MKISFYSDLHLEFAPYTPPRTDADVVVLAGDIHTKGRALDWALETFGDTPVLYVLGNHEYYGKAYPKHLEDLKARASGTSVQVLENDCMTLNGVNFLGCSLWTDFSLFGDARITGYDCEQIMNDFRKIRRVPGYSKIRALDFTAIHRASLRWLESELEKRRGEINVVISHHAPSPRSLPDGRAVNSVDAAYANDLEAFLELQDIELWIHGHTHNSSDYRIGGCRVISNPRGYPSELNPDYREDWLIVKE